MSRTIRQEAETMFDQRHHPGKGTLTQGPGHPSNGTELQAPGKQSRVEHELGRSGHGAPNAANATNGEHSRHGHHQEQAAHGNTLATHPSDAPGDPAMLSCTDEASGVDMVKLKSLIAEHEGYRTDVYRDTEGNLTVGIGHALPSNGRYHVGQHFSQQQVEKWYEHDVAEAIRGVKEHVGSAVYDRLDEERRYPLIDIAFNVGSAGFGKFVQLIAALKRRDYARAAHEIIDSKLAPARARQDAALMRERNVVVEAPPGTFPKGSHPVSLAGDDPPCNGGKDGAEGHGGATSHGGKAPTIADVRAGRGVLKIGEHGPAVAEIQQLLQITADGIFGPKTQHAVERFQHANHLAVDGIVGRATIKVLDPVAKASTHAGAGHATGGAAPPGDGGSDRAAHSQWSRAPTLDAVRSGAATLHEGERGLAVKHVQFLLAVDTDGEFGPVTRAAVVHFEKQQHLERHDGVIDAPTLASLTHHPVKGVEGESGKGSAQREKLLGIARAGSEGRKPDGLCYSHVCDFLAKCNGYGKIKDPRQQFPPGALPLAHDFADFINAQGPKQWGLERLSISSPYDAPPGAIVVVKAGSPGTSDPTAGDISVAGGDGHFFNGGMMKYGGREGWDTSPRARLLGAYVPL
jgi:lysozyme